MKSLILSFLILVQCVSCAQEAPVKAPATTANIIFKSDDGGQTWEDVSAGLPENLGINGVFLKEENLFLATQSGFYRSNTATTSPVWQKEFMFNEGAKGISGVYPSQTGLYAFTGTNNFFQQIRGVGAWLPVLTEIKNHGPHTLLETLAGAILVGARNGIWKSNDYGRTWKHVHKEGWVMQIVEAEGVLICTNEQGILRSTDGGESWELVISEGGVGIDVEAIKGGFAAITFNTESKTRRMRISKDGGKNWDTIDADLPPNLSISCIKEVGESFFCGHPDGIFRSDDQGKTWKRILPSIGKKVFNLSVLGKSIYAIPRNAGC
ncbi:MAG: WD40/YVTN/BNR-like repeat-containing protein [Bacteroidia bacterium]